jgi:enamine deaminase RidA (YjgF/YER057c/UK114 family)
VSGKNISGSAVALGAWAVEPFAGGFSLCEVPSPLQGPAPAYGSSFSRAVEMKTPDFRRLLVSGTASIDLDGQSAFEGDTAAQIDFTMRVVHAILRSRGMGFGHVSRATAYLKNAQDACFFEAWLAREGLEGWPVFCAQADICRDELLFEIELDALALT